LQEQQAAAVIDIEPGQDILWQADSGDVTVV
jgi:hypothetical protein